MPDLPYSVRMSITVGPIDPDSTGKSSVLPSGSFSVAFLSMDSSSAGAQALHRRAIPFVHQVAATAHNVPEVVVGGIEQLRQHPVLRMFQQVALENQVQLEQAATAFPLQPVAFARVHHTVRRTIISLILPMALVGLRFFGQTSTQFMMV